MCYSAKVLQRIRDYERRVGARPDLRQIEQVLTRRLTDPSIRIARAFEANFADPRTPDERHLADLIAQHRAKTATAWQQELFAQKRRLADAQRRLRDKPTKAAREAERIASAKIAALTARLTEIDSAELKDDDWRVFPMYFAPIVIREDGENRVILARYHCRPEGQPASIDRKFPGLYNARRDNLEKFWRHEFGRNHALLVIDSFYEHVEREGKNVVLQFVPNPPQPMLVAALYSRWQHPGEDELVSFAAITDEPPPEIAAAGHDRCVINLSAEGVEDWLTPQGRSSQELQAILDHRERPYYAHHVMAA